MKHLIVIFCLAFFVFGCSKNSSDDNPTGEEENPDLVENGDEGSVSLYFPQEDMLCNEGEDLTPTESTVFFEWEDNASDNYKVVIENLSTGNVIERETTEDIIPIVIQRATPYKWFVASTKGSKTEKSAIWQFYNAGPGVQSYAPFPAVIVAPTMAQSISSTTSLTLQWTGSDVDADIVSYDVYFGTVPEPNLINNVIANELNVDVSSNTIYFWKIVTVDSLGNSSDSGIFQFQIL